jgi:photosystem II stability/assembly factor-like uncharacterized protein
MFDESRYSSWMGARARAGWRIVSGAVLAGSIALFARDARANGRLPASSALAFDPSSSSRVYMRTTFGLLVSNDGGHAWDWICDRAVGLNGPEDPTIGIFANGDVAATMLRGLGMTTDGACTFTLVGGDLANRLFVDLAVRKSTPASGVAVASGYANQVDDAGDPLFASQVFVTTDSGKTWTKLGAPLDPTLLVETIDWSDADPNRMYISAARGTGSTPSGVLLESDDGGSSWTEHAVDLVTPPERAPYIAALDPKNADVLYVRTGGDITAAARLLVSKDAGKTWTKVLTTSGPMLGFALSEDGKKVFAGGPNDGVLEAPTDTFVFTKKSSLSVRCLAYRSGELWACSDEATTFTAGVSADDGATFDARLHLRDVRGPLACPPDTPTAQLCAADWPGQEALLGITPPGAESPDTNDGGANAKGSAGCASAADEPRSASLTTAILAGLVAAGALAIARRGRRVRRPPPR